MTRMPPPAIRTAVLSTAAALALAASLATPAQAASQAASGPAEGTMMEGTAMQGKAMNAPAATAGPGAAAATTDAVTVGDLTIEGAWTRQPPPGARAGAGYLAVTNRGAEPDRLVGGEALFAEAVEIHAMSVVDGVMRMEEMEDGLTIAPGETARLAPGGNHVMMIGLARGALVEGGTVTVRLRFERAGEVDVAMPVAAIGARVRPGSPATAMDGRGRGTKTVEGMDHSGADHSSADHSGADHSGMDHSGAAPAPGAATQ